MEQKDANVVDYDDIDYSNELFALYEDRRFTGRAVELDPERNKTIETEFAGGIKHGPEREYYPGGALKSEVVFKMGQPHSIGRQWHINGQLKWETTYENGRAVNRKHWSEDGRQLPVQPGDGEP
jgi:antitoxin component YwqK of YwqJK toxin-antitoxin module